MVEDRDFGDEPRRRAPIVVAGELVRRENDPLANEAAMVIRDLLEQIKRERRECQEAIDRCCSRD